MPLNDQVSVLLHEMIHVEKDYSYNPDLKIAVLKQDFIFSSSMSNDVYAYYKSINFGDTIEEIVTYLQDNYYGVLSDPQKYLNEIDTIEEEKKLNPNVSEQYSREREAKLYHYQQMYRIARGGL